MDAAQPPGNDNFSSLFEFIPLGAYRSSPAGLQLRANPALVKLNGFDSEAEQLACVRDIAINWYVDPQRREEFKRVLEREGQVVGFESEIWRYKTRERIWISEHAHVVRDVDGAVLFYEGTVEEITQRRANQEELQRNGEIWKRALESTGDGVWDWHVQQGVEILSPACKALFGYGPQDLADTPEAMDDLTHPDDQKRMFQDREEHFSLRQARYVNEHRVRCKDGSWKWVLSRGVVISRDADGRPLRMIGTHTDIHDAKQSGALRAERDRAEAADHAKSQFLSRVSHELRTPLNAILGFSQLLELDSGLQARQRGWVGHVLSSGRHLLALMDDVLDLSALQTGQLPVALEPVSIGDVLRTVHTMLQATATSADVVLVVPPQGAADIRVLADRKRLLQIVSNLLSNAIKYNRPGGSATVTVRRNETSVEMDIADTGPGLSDEQIARLFQPFERLDAKRAGVDGTGLGLALTRQFTEAMGGSVSVKSRPGEGAVFTVCLLAA